MEDVMILQKTANNYPIMNIPELDIRQEMLDLFSGVDFENIKYMPIIVRHIRRAKSGDRIKCSCFSEERGEGLANCPYCDGVGYLWDESLVPSYIYRTKYQGLAKNLSVVDRGRIEDGYMEMIVPYSIQVNNLDLIYKVLTDGNGKIISPIERTESFIVAYSIETGFDFGKKDFTMVIMKRM